MNKLHVIFEDSCKSAFRQKNRSMFSNLSIRSHRVVNQI